MKFIANGINGSYLRSVLPGEDVEVDGVLAAIAYGSDENTLIRNCLDHKRRLDLWMRYDHTVPVSISLLRKLLSYNSRDVFCYQIPDVLHAKVIWWRGYGAYIGSANLSDRAWISNIEAGVFLSEGDLHQHGTIDELENFFDGLRSLEQTFQLTQETVDELESIQQIRKSIFSIDKKAEEKRTIPKFEGVNFIEKKSQRDRRKKAFQKEWHETLTYLRSISNVVVKYRPKWINEETPAAWQADQFLHAYYYNHVRDGNRYPVDEFFRKNKVNPSDALADELKWWSTLREPPTSEDVNLERNAPYIRDLLSKDNISQMTVKQFALLCEYTHAVRDHVKKISLSTFGIAERTMSTTEERVELFADWMWRQLNSHGMGAKEILREILFGGEESKIWERLYKFSRDPEYKLPHYGINSLAEIVGWARPDVMPPRNGRTSKALKALGYSVKVY